MNGRAGGAMTCAVAMVACLVVSAASPARAYAPGPRLEAPGSAPLLHRSADSGIDIVRMPQRPSTGGQPPGTPAAQTPPALTPPVTPPVVTPPNQPPQPQGRLVKVTAKIGGQPKEPQKG